MTTPIEATSATAIVNNIETLCASLRPNERYILAVPYSIYLIEIIEEANRDQDKEKAIHWINRFHEIHDEFFGDLPNLPNAEAFLTFHRRHQHLHKLERDIIGISQCNQK